MRSTVINFLGSVVLTVVAAGCGMASGSPPKSDGGIGDGGGGDGGAYCSVEGYSCSTVSCCQGYTCDAKSVRCVPSSKNALGQTCSGNSECASGLCYDGNSSFSIPYCSRACKGDMDCIFKDSTACCNGGTCEIISGAYCGDRSGDTGHSCYSGGSSDCKNGLFCAGTRNPDGTFSSDAICSKTCTSTSECLNLEDPETLCLVCESGASGTQKHCQVDLLCAGKCTNDAKCEAEGGRCSMQPVLDKNGKTVDLTWACSQTCQWGGTKGYDSECSADGECCSPLCIRGRCVGACAGNADCGPGHLCQGLSLGLDPDDDCLVARLSMCISFSGSGTVCSANSDCQNDEYCQYAPESSGAARSLCGKAPADGLVGGEKCSGTGTECMSAFCSSLGYCIDFCRTDSDCPTKTGKMICASVDMGGGVGKGICLAAEGSQNACVRDADCGNGEICKPFPVKDGSKTLCVTGIKSGKRPGEKCTKSSACANDLCLSNGYCSAICSVDSDCPVTPGISWFCARVGFETDSYFTGCIPMPGSGKQCSIDSECSAGEVCKYLTAPDGSARTVCGTATANGLSNGAGLAEECRTCTDPCDKTCSPINCANDMCLDSGLCSEVCRFNADCAEAGWICVEEPGSGLHFCLEQGNILCATCTTDADCMGTDENFCNDLPEGGKACGRGCNPILPVDCPEGYSCSEVFASNMTSRGYNCVPTSGSCPATSAMNISGPADGKNVTVKNRPLNLVTTDKFD